MAEAIVTRIGRKKMVQARAGYRELPPIVGMAFGNGGVDESGEVIIPMEDQTELNSELLRKRIDSYGFLDDVTCRYTCTLTESELAGEVISELALYDGEDDLVVIKNFTGKGKDDDLEMTFNVDDMF